MYLQEKIWKVDEFVGCVISKEYGIRAFSELLSSTTLYELSKRGAGGEKIECGGANIVEFTQCGNDAVGKVKDVSTVNELGNCL